VEGSQKGVFSNADRIIIDVHMHTHNLYGFSLSDIGKTKLQHCLEQLIEKTDLVASEEHLGEEFNSYLLDFLISSTHFFIKNGLVERRDGKFVKADIFDVAWNRWRQLPSGTDNQQNSDQTQPEMAQASNNSVQDTMAVEDGEQQ
jgi:hypothetical protein